MTDRQLSAETFLEWGAKEDAYANNKKWEAQQQGNDDAYMFYEGYQRALKECRNAIDTGQLDAECPKCGGSGVSRIVEFLEDGTTTVERCDCPAGNPE